MQRINNVPAFKIIPYIVPKINKVINVSKPSIKLDDTAALEEVLASGWLGQGDKVFSFEKKCKETLHCKHFIALSSCTKAIEVALLMTGCSYGDEVIIPSLTYASVIQVILKLGLVPIFADINTRDLSIIPSDIEKKISPKTRVILPLHFRGHAYNVDAVKKIAGEYNLLIIEDAAHAFGSYYNNEPVGADTFISCFSFGPLKNICCIEGGGIATNNDEIAARILSYRSLGMDHSTWSRYNSATRSPWHYRVISRGDKCELNNVNAAVGLMQLSRIDEIKRSKKIIVKNYIDALAGIEGIEIPNTDVEKDFAYIFTILVNSGIRERLMSHLWNKGISTAIHYYPNHMQPFFAKYDNGPLPGTEEIGARILTLPSYTDLTETDQSYVTEEIRKFMKTI